MPEDYFHCLAPAHGSGMCSTKGVYGGGGEWGWGSVYVCEGVCVGCVGMWVCSCGGVCVWLWVCVYMAVCVCRVCVCVRMWVDVGVRAHSHVREGRNV